MGGVPNPVGTRFLLAGAQAWHAQAEAAHRPMSAVATGLCMALLQNQMDVPLVHARTPNFVLASNF